MRPSPNVLLAFAIVAAAGLVSDGRVVAQSLPQTAEPPAARPQPDAEVEDAADGRSTDQAGPVSDAPVPEPRPDDTVETVDPVEPVEPPVAVRPSPQAPTPELPAAVPPATTAGDVACHARLAKLAIRFETKPSITEDGGCSVASPVVVSSVGAVRIEPEALLDCETAETLGKFVAETVAPETMSAFGSPLVSIRQDSAYVCRPRHGTETLSEHAFGRAIDFGAFLLEDGRSVAVAETSDATVGRYLARLRKAACGPFMTVLGPGSDADHATHFHFDLAPRKSGAYCR